MSHGGMQCHYYVQNKSNRQAVMTQNSPVTCALLLQQLEVRTSQLATDACVWALESLPQRPGQEK